MIVCPNCLAELREAVDCHWCEECGGYYPLVNGHPVLIDFRCLLGLGENVYAAWHLSQVRGQALYEQNDSGSCSTEGRDDVEQFRNYLAEIVLEADVLDIGSGSFFLPGYIAGLSYKSFVGLDPIPGSDAPFPHVTAVAEQLPIPDESFDVVLFATSLDHCFDLGRSLVEARRVLRPNGRIVIWEALYDDRGSTFSLVGHEFERPTTKPLVRGKGFAQVEADWHHTQREMKSAELRVEEPDVQRLLVDDFHLHHVSVADLAEAITQSGLVIADHTVCVFGGDWSGSYLTLARQDLVDVESMMTEAIKAFQSRQQLESLAMRVSALEMPTTDGGTLEYVNALHLQLAAISENNDARILDLVTQVRALGEALASVQLRESGSSLPDQGENLTEAESLKDQLQERVILLEQKLPLALGEDVRERLLLLEQKLQVAIDRDAAQRLALRLNSVGNSPHRILLIGNIANNAFHCGSILRSLGLDVTVLCFDYYHAMATPEWDAAPLIAAPEDANYPDWHRMDKEQFVRPSWFLQGPQLALLRGLVEMQNPSSVLTPEDWIVVLNGLCVLHGTSEGRASLDGFYDERIGRFGGGSEAVAGALRWFEQSPVSSVESVRNLVQLSRTEGYGWLGQLHCVVAASDSDNARFDARVAAIVREMKVQYPEVPFGPDTFEAYRDVMPDWKRALETFDTVVAFATDGVYPLLADIPYISFEHGTLRFAHADPLGESTELAHDLTAQRILAVYSRASSAMITNPDQLPRSTFILPAENVIVNHPFDPSLTNADTGESVAQLRSELLTKLSADYLLFLPSQHSYRYKASLLVLEAFAMLQREGLRVGLVAARWGLDVSDSEIWLAERNLDSSVIWIDPVPSVLLGRYMRAADVVFDQFLAGGLSGVLFRALSNGANVCTHPIDISDPPPIIQASSADEIYRHVATALASDSGRARRSAEATKWFNLHHGPWTGAEKLLETILRLPRNPKPLDGVILGDKHIGVGDAPAFTESMPIRKLGFRAKIRARLFR